MRNRQKGQGMVEFTIVLVFGVMVMSIGPGGDVLLDLLGVINDKYQGYSYAASLSDLPEHDNLAAYVIAEANGVDPNNLVNQINSFTSFPTITTPSTNLLPSSPSGLLNSATSFF